MENTALAEMYKKGDYTPPTLEEYIESATYLITHIDPETIVHRITGDCPENMLLAPIWNRDKNAVIAAVQSELEEKNLRQGMYYKT